jgi:DNA-binding transcriptional MerR regulator
MDTRTVGAVARLAGISVRTLHHYDEIGLLRPSERRANGYRAYTADDIDRLHKILTYRELDLGLGEIERLLERPGSAVDALRAARDRVASRMVKLERIAASLDGAIAAASKGATMTPEDKLSVFGDFDPDEHAEEARERWGGTDAYAESARRTKSYTTDDWKRHNEESAVIYGGLMGLKEAGTDPASPEAAELVDAHRALITKWFYDCTAEIHAGLGAMYVADERFRQNIDKSGDGLADYLSNAIAARYA